MPDDNKNTKKLLEDDFNKADNLILSLEDIVNNQEYVSDEEWLLWGYKINVIEDYARLTDFSEQEMDVLLEKREDGKSGYDILFSNTEFVNLDAEEKNILKAKLIELNALLSLLGKRTSALYGNNGGRLKQVEDYIPSYDFDVVFDELIGIVGYEGIVSNTVKYMVSALYYNKGRKLVFNPDVRSSFSQESIDYSRAIAIVSYIPVFVLGVVPQIENYLRQTPQNYMQIFAFFGPIIGSVLALALLSITLSSIVYGVFYLVSNKYNGYRLFFYIAFTFWSIMYVYFASTVS